MINYKFIATDEFKKEFKKLDNSIQISILKYIKKFENSENPKAFAKSLSGNFSGYYRFRVANNYRLIVEFKDEKLIILGLAVGNRSTIYNRFKI